VSFIAVGDAYVYIRESFTENQKAGATEPVRARPVEEKLRRSA
jgi:hypothetical protein